MKLVCPRCGMAIAGADIDLPRGIGVCRPCGELVPLPEALASTGLPLVPQTTTPYRPESLRLIERGDAMHYEAAMPPNRLGTLPMLFFTLFWDGFMAVWYTIAILGRIWPMALFGLLHLSVGFYMTHKVLVGLFNTRRMSIADGRVRFTSGPIPTGRPFEASVGDLDGFSVTAKTSSSRTGTTTTFGVVANLANGSSKELPLGLDDGPSTEFAVRRFNDVLGEAKTQAALVPYRS